MNPILLDTQAYLWLVMRDDSLTPAALEAFERAATIYLSVASLWEIGIKAGLGKLDIDVELRRLVAELPQEKSIIVLPDEPSHILRAARLPHYHRDPFDRMIVAQALEEDLTVVGSYKTFDAYGVARIF